MPLHQNDCYYDCTHKNATDNYIKNQLILLESKYEYQIRSLIEQLNHKNI